MIKLTAAVFLGLPLATPARTTLAIAPPPALRGSVLRPLGMALPTAAAGASLPLARSRPALLARPVLSPAAALAAPEPGAAPFAAPLPPKLSLPPAVRPDAPPQGARPLFASLSLPQPAWSDASASELKDGAGADFARRIGGFEPPAAPGASGEPPGDPAPPAGGGKRVAPEAVVAKILSLFARGAGVDPRTGYPFDEWRMGSRARRYTQPTAIGQRLELLGHVIAGDVAGLPEPERARARADARRMLGQMLDDQRRRGHLGLLPWLRLNRKGRPQGAEHGFIDNANLSASVMAFLGSVDRAGGDAGLEQAARRFLDAQAPGYAALFDVKTGLFWGALRSGEHPLGYHVDRFFSEHRAKTAAVVAYFGRSNPSFESAFRELRPAYRKYRFADGTRRDVPATWDGGLFQMSWNIPFESAFYAELPELARIGHDFLDAAVDEAERAGRRGFLSASATDAGEGYDGRIGLAALKERPEAVNASAESIYALGPYFGTRRELVLAWLGRYAGDGPFGPFDAYSGGRWLERYFAVDQGSLALGLIGRQGESLRAFLEREGLAGRFVGLYRETLNRPEHRRS